MLRITEKHDVDLLIFQLAGKLTGASAIELGRLWRDAVEAKKPRRLLVDLSEVVFIDETGKAVLALMVQAGAELIAIDVLMKSIVEEITAETAVK